MTDPIQLLIDAGAIPGAPFEPQSRYQGLPLAVYRSRPDAPGQLFVTRRFMPAPGSIATAGRHVVRAGDRPDALGARYLGDPLLYWRIADANAVVDPNELTDTLGRRLVLPLPTGL